MDYHRVPERALSPSPGRVKFRFKRITIILINFSCLIVKVRPLYKERGYFYSKYTFFGAENAEKFISRATTPKIQSVLTFRFSPGG